MILLFFNIFIISKFRVLNKKIFNKYGRKFEIDSHNIIFPIGLNI